ncbi:MAG: transcription antitermination factor NusB [Cyclobacteriaceae bacterium]|nr:transcription antitermination factor NusB [Cyclobacteriaceae bacterium]
MEVQDPVKLAQERKMCLAVFEKNLKNKYFQPEDGNKINETASDALRDFYKANDRDYLNVKKSLLKDTNKILDLFNLLLNLPAEFKHLAENDKRGNHQNYVNNLLIKALSLNKENESATLANSFRWENHLSDVKEWFRTTLMADEKYQAYNQLEKPSFEDDREIATHIMKKCVFSNELINTFMEELDLYWDENKPVIRSLILKTIKGVEEEGSEEMKLPELSYNWEDDKSFFVKLYEETVNLDDRYKEIIGLKAENWDIERLAVTDRIILEMAIAEMLCFPSIPIKVTINEYIEVSKRYSTPKSKQFINGMLDVIADQLVAEGDVTKSGRGLLDNK